MGDEIIKPILISIVGPTAVGKTTLAIELARELKTEIISADSRQFFREMKIGTAKPSEKELKLVRHHFINSHSIEESYNAGEYGRDAQKLLSELFRKRKVVIAVGGSTLYLKSIWEGFDEIPLVDSSIREQLNRELKEVGLDRLLLELEQSDKEYFDEVDKNNGQRIVRALEVIRGTGKKFSFFRKSKKNKIPYRNIKIGLNLGRESLYKRINERMDLMIQQGLFEEASALFPYGDHNALQTVGYSEIFGFMDGDYDKAEAIRLLKRNSRRYAKKQLTWFNKYDDIHWYEPLQQNEILTFVKTQMSNK